MKYSRLIILPLVILTLFVGLVAGVVRFGLHQNNTSTDKTSADAMALADANSNAQSLKGPWFYKINNVQAGTVFLPWNLSVPLTTEQVDLTITLPKWQGEGYALHFISIQQSVEVKIDGETRYTYGAEPDDPRFVYRSASNLNRVPLNMADSGKELTIIYTSSPLFASELGLMREVWFGTESNLVIHQLLVSLPSVLATLFSLATVLATLLMLATYRGAPLKVNFCTLFLALIVIILVSTEFTILWPIFHHSPKLSILYDWSFFFFDALVAPAAWLTMYVSGWDFEGWRGRVAILYCYSFVLAVVLSLSGLFNFNLTRPVFMLSSIVITVCLVLDRKNHRKLAGQYGLALPALVLLGGYYIDYLKYCLMILPISSEWSVFLQLKLPFQFFTTIALVIFSMMTLRATMSELSNRQAAVQEEMSIAKLQTRYAVQQYETVCQHDLTMRTLRHDMQHHIRTAVALLETGDKEEAKQYLVGLTDTVAELRLVPWCEDHVADITIGWYSEQFSQRGIPFSMEVNIPPIVEAAHADVCCVLSNALQNALEASMGINSPSITLHAEPKGDVLLIKVINHCATIIKTNKANKANKGQFFPTTKLEEGHGLGITSMNAAVQRHNGYLHAEADEGIFKLDAVLCGILSREN